MSNKEKCKEIMSDLFGPASAAQVDGMSEDDCVSICRAKVANFLGEKKAVIFDKI